MLTYRTSAGQRLLGGSVAVVTGAGRGIGRAVATLFAAHGSTVFAVARTVDDLESLARQVSEPGNIVSEPGDVTDRSFVDHLFRTVDATHGRLDILVNNAGCAPFGSIFEMDPDDFRSCLEINVWSAFLCTQQALMIMRRSGRGKVINIGSVRSHWTEAGDAGAYNASKYGLRGFTESVAREIHGQGMNIAIGLVCPGVVDTSLTNPGGEPRPGWLTPRDAAGAVLHAVTAPDGVNVFDTVLIPVSQKPW